MKAFNPWLWLLLAGYGPGMADARLQLLPGTEPQRVFAGEARKVAVTWHNAGDISASADVHTLLYQASSVTATPLSPKVWKTIEILPRQTVLESAPMDFPAVNVETRFLIQWQEDTHHVLGNTEVLVYPTNLLGELNSLFGKDILGVLDPDNELKPLLRQNSVSFIDLAETGLEDFRGRLAIIGPFSTKAQRREGLTPTIRKIAGKGVAVVWIQPLSEPKDQIQPSFYIVPEGKAPVVVVQADLVANPAGNPQAQLNLVYFCRLALNPAPFSLPDLKAQP